MLKPVFDIATYFVRVTGQALGKSKNKGTTQFVLQFTVLGKVNPADPEGDLLECPQGERSIYMYITAKTADFVAKNLQDLGYDRTSWADLNPDNPGHFDFTGVQFAASCTHEEYEGELKERWGLARTGMFDNTPLEAKEVRQLDALFGKALKGGSAPKQQALSEKDAEQPEIAINEEGEPISVNDDIPF
jgi:hypothetical protein